MGRRRFPRAGRRDNIAGMRYLAALLVGLFVSCSALAAEKKPPSFAPITIPLRVVEGDLFNRDCRVFGLPVECAGVSATFTWACGGETIVSETFAKRARLT